VAGVTPGTATITATAETKSGSATVGVEVVSFATVQAGAYHSCGLTASGGAYCWGHGAYGQLGGGAKASSLAPVAVGGGLNLAAISVGAVHTCGLTTGGAAYCWGLDYYGELGAGAPSAELCGSEAGECSTTPLAVAGGHSFSSLAAGWEQSCALTSAGAAYCWGTNTYGGLGDGSTASSPTPVQVTGGLTFASIVTGIVFACGLTPAGEAYCWGNNTYGQLGIGSTSPDICNSEACSKTPVAVSGGLTFVALSVGYWHACGLTSGGAAYCWGDNADGQLGAATTEKCAGLGTVVSCSMVPLPVNGGLTFATLSAGSFHSCGVTTGDAGYCWGANADGQLGNGTTTATATPTAIVGGLTFAALSAVGRWHSCGLSAAGIAYCWGYNGLGQLGTGATSSAYEPVPVVGQAATSGTAQAARVRRRAARTASPLVSARVPSALSTGPRSRP
jgi:alpha-tubulin suppressor-like RCC1 family protein